MSDEILQGELIDAAAAEVDVASLEANQRLLDQYREIATLAGALAHEIKNPLSTIRMNMELLLEDFPQDAELSPQQKRVRNKLSIVERECGRLQELLDNFLDFAKLRRMKLQPTDLNRVIEELLEFQSPSLAAAKIEVVKYLNRDLPTVLVDREALQTALLNLVINAQQAMPSGGQLVAHTRYSPQGIALDLIDTGPGMDEKTRKQVFQAFYTTKPGGTGLGLPTARKLLEMQGGQIHLQSEPGRGTKFTVELPAAPALPGPEE